MLSVLADHSSSRRAHAGAAADVLVHCYVADADPMARHLLVAMLTRHAGTFLVGSTSDERSLLHDLRILRPDVLFIDARMGSDLLRARLADDEASSPCLVVVSALTEDAVAAFACDAIDFVLKPCSRMRLGESLERVRRRIAEQTAVAGARSAGQVSADRFTTMTSSLAAVPTDRADVIAIATRGATDYVPTATIHSLVADGAMTRIATSDAVLETAMPLFTVERLLRADLFVRVHRSAIVNVRWVRRLENHGTGGRLVLHSGDVLPVSKRRISAVRLALAPQNVEQKP